MCKISGKIEFSHHGFVMAFCMQKAKKKPRARRGEDLLKYFFLKFHIFPIISKKIIK